MASPYGAVIKRLRETRSWTQQELADHAGVNRETVVRAEQSGNVGVLLLMQLASALDVSLTEVFGGHAHAVVAPPDWWDRLNVEQRRRVARIARRYLGDEDEAETPTATE